MKKEQEYTPFGEEWEKELMKMPKKMIIDLYRISCVRKGKSPDYLLPDGYVEEWESEPVPTPFNEALVLLQELYDLQNGAPLERYKEQWAETMAKIDYFLSKWPTLPQPPKTNKP